MLFDEIKRFNGFDLNQVVHSNEEWNFNNKRQSIDEIYEMFREIIEIIQLSPLNDWASIPLNEYLLHFNNLLNQLSIYDRKKDDNENRGYNNLLRGIDNAYLQFFGLLDERNPAYPSLKNYNFLSIYNYVKQKGANSLGNAAKFAQQKLNEIGEIEIKANDLHKEMQRQSTETVSEKYANIFAQEALIHSNKDLKRGVRGEAQNWLISAGLGVLSFILFIYFIDRIMPIDKSETNSTIIVIEYLRRLLIVSFIIYLITFMFRQYSIHKHLSTVNKHRENTLNSFKLFIQSIDSSDSDVKNTIVKEIAKAIYDSGETGYINLKQSLPDSSSIVTEITKYIKPN